MSELTHLDNEGRVRMVDVSDKQPSLRRARAEGSIHMKPETLSQILSGQGRKGNVLETARIAGIMAAKRTAELIPMCHPLILTGIRVDFTTDRNHNCIGIEAEVKTFDKTGVEMEALTAVAAAALTLYDMAKSMDKTMEISGIRLMEKEGGKSGMFVRSSL
ncbi:cyclic pyranopterin monophosphate synthase MoaC [Desulfobotulus sp. H1]|uniref:Cyclic pyranopterin monophosphate synthase n=1 Tax=Desulfobotulus pelophilus TaxID=2823377 RepID=A0ABT3NB46_9BACT|nr:cyclic pyranopterin monophosphate synthase MoaC [Desulfobotulus pelophilus]MCW7754694.1 cyclic pyranopterin monophosphate synthase MoaC [Desulfobotulus pelophilus]